MLACASLAVNKEALACSFSRAPALPLNTHDALIRQEASPSQRLATCLIFLFCLVVVHKQQSNANLADATNYARMLPRRTQKMCAPCSAPITKRAIIDQASLHSGFIAPCIICTQRENQCIAFPAHKYMCAAKIQVMRFSSMHKKRLHKTCSALVPQHEKKKWRKKKAKKENRDSLVFALFSPFFSRVLVGFCQ